MHIALVILTLGPGGAERVLSDLANSWVEEGHSITILTLEHPSQKPFFPLDPRVNLIQLNPQRQKPPSRLGALKNTLKRLWLLRKTLKSLHPDLILSFIDQMNILTLLLTRTLSIPVLISERIDPAFYPLSLPYKILRPFTYGWAARIIVQTQSAKNYFSHRLQKKISIIPNSVPVPKDILLSSSPKKITHLVSVGRLDFQKDHPTLLKALKILIPQYPFLKLTIYGEGKERKSLERLVRTLNLESHVSLPGTRDNISACLLKYDLFIFPSLFEGFPNALCEAMSLGLPVIASRCSGNQDVVQDGIDGRLFSVGNAEELAKIIEELIQNPSQARCLGNHALDLTERFQKEKVLSLWRSAIEKAVSCHEKRK